MTGRRLYDIHCDAYAQYLAHLKTPLPAWPFLTYRERQMWSAMAARMKGVKR